MDLRQRFAEGLAKELRRVLATCDLPYPEIRLAYRPSLKDRRTTEAVAEALEAAAPEELRRRRPGPGPHRDDLGLAWGPEAVKGVASAGETKALGLALLAAQGQVLAGVGREPLYLLDDADAELSRSTLEAVWKAFEDAAQLFASSNRPEVWEALGRARRWRLFQGTLKDDLSL